MITSLIRRIEAGDLAAAGSLIQRFQDRVFRSFLKRGCSHHDARDLAQETFLGVIKTLHTFDPHRSRFEFWLSGISRNTFLQWVRTTSRQAGHLEKFSELQKAQGSGVDESVGVDDGPFDLDEEESRSTQLETYITMLGKKLREAMELAVRGMASDEIAEVLGISRAGVRARLRAATRKIRKIYEREKRRCDRDTEFRS
ncbi:MAG: hypothetical protein DHS20C21_23460 [Gemmatimonadota bacterium]|nr:MAG: hypothetical protein DHS20C21_23460 [Gemmatimonadota bacterium]